MTDLESLVYSNYQWGLGGDYLLPGLNEKGFVDPDFFDAPPKKNNYTAFSDLFDLIKYDPILNNNEGLMLCSGGVDSSLLACFRSQNLTEIPQNLIHTSYVGHNNNDLQKFINVIEACPSHSFVSSIDAKGYVAGIEFLSTHNFYQNTYAPTLAFALSSIETHGFSTLITGSGPDELFYGMEKYSWDTFEKLSEKSIPQSLEGLDPTYNL